MQAMPYLAQARRLLSNVRNSVNRYKLLWVEARVMAKLGSTRTAARRLINAHTQLLRVGALREAALVALEVALLFLRTGQWAELKAMALVTMQRFEELDADTEALAALAVLLKGDQLRSLNDKILRSARDRIETVIARATPTTP